MVGRLALGFVVLAFAVLQQSPSKPVEATTFAPIGFFNKNCYYCHPKDGAGYPTDFGKGYDEKKLYDRLLDMTEEKARVALTDKELDVLASWMRSLMKKEPYVAWVETKGTELSFEATAGAAVTATVKGSAVAIRQDKGLWKLMRPPGSVAGDVVVTATVQRKSTKLALKDAASSHTKKLGAR
ncbi:MAG: cytochrome c [Fimbriimonadaceae bacterium]